MRKPLGLTLALVVVAIAGIVLGLRVAGPATYETPLGDVRVEVRPALEGRVDAYVPIADWGVRAPVFEGPLELRGEIRSVERGAVLRAATGEGQILEDTRASLDGVAADALIRAVLFAIGGAALLGIIAAFVLAAFGERRRKFLAGAVIGTVLGAALIIGGSALVVRLTFDPEAVVERPSFYARGAELLQLLQAATKTQERVERYQATAENGVRAFSELLAAGGIDEVGGFADERDQQSAVLASDLHNNTLAVSALEALGDGDEPVFFVGDFGHEGSEGEARLVASRLADLGPRVVAVSGNHDSRILMQRLADAGVTVLTEEGPLGREGDPIIEVDGMKVAGVADPLEWQGNRPGDPRRIFSYSELPDGDRRMEEDAARIVRWFDALPERPNIVLIHNNGLARRFARALHARGPQPRLLVLTGHDHKQWVELHGDVVIVDAGTAGAGGILGVGSQKVGLGELRFGDAGALAAVDLIQAEPLLGGAQAERVVVAGRECDDPEKECRLSG